MHLRTLSREEGNLSEFPNPAICAANHFQPLFCPPPLYASLKWAFFATYQRMLHTSPSILNPHPRPLRLNSKCEPLCHHTSSFTLPINPRNTHPWLPPFFNPNFGCPPPPRGTIFSHPKEFTPPFPPPTRPWALPPSLAFAGPANFAPVLVGAIAGALYATRLHSP